MKMINPYLGFKDQCEEAFTFYKSVFGGEFTSFQRFGDVPKDAGVVQDESEKNKVMHVALPIGTSGTMLMGSDAPSGMEPPRTGTNISISVHPDSEEEAKRIFDGLCAGGTVTMPLDKTFWNAYFGMCTDKFGVNWMVNYDYSQST